MAPRIILDFPDSFGDPQRRVFSTPGRVISTADMTEVLPALREVAALTASGGIAVGFVSYEAAPAFDAAFRTRARGAIPLLWFAIAEEVAPIEHPAGQTTLGEWHLEIDADEHAAAVRRIREEIAAGSTYQVNLTARMHARFEGDALTLYESLRRARGRGYHAFIETDEWAVLSLSPELFFETDEFNIRSKPMKGTRGRGRFQEEDETLALELRDSAKERAENLMIVDLMRNDIGRVAEAGSVQVNALYEIERYPTVHQMTSTVTATLRDGVILPDIFSALFPPGSVTGAPKISTMGLIAELERSARGVYCGAIGIVEAGRSVFNVPIRTIWLDRVRGVAEYGSGGGITTDSRAESEYQELLTKALVVSQPWPRFDLLETMRAEVGVITRLDRHLQRLQRSANYFDYPFAENVIASVLANVVQSDSGRVRLLLDQHGHARAELHVLEELPAEPRIALAAAPVATRNRFLYHKTTHRRDYERHLAAVDGSAFDVLLWNERGEVTEFTRGNVVLELAGQRVTPARACGLLAGVFREELLERSEIEERVIGRDDVARASRIWFINSVRGWVEVGLL